MSLPPRPLQKHPEEKKAQAERRWACEGAKECRLVSRSVAPAQQRRASQRSGSRRGLGAGLRFLPSPPQGWPSRSSPALTVSSRGAWRSPRGLSHCGQDCRREFRPPGHSLSIRRALSYRFKQPLSPPIEPRRWRVVRHLNQEHQRPRPRRARRLPEMRPRMPQRRAPPLPRQRPRPHAPLRRRSLPREHRRRPLRRPERPRRPRHRAFQSLPARSLFRGHPPHTRCPLER
jgi:hypothetical protein